MNNQQIFLIILFVAILLMVSVNGNSIMSSLRSAVPTRSLSQEELSHYTAATGAILLTSTSGVTLDQGNQTIIVGPNAITMNAGIAAGNTVMTVYGVNGSVGIGTTIPTQKLHISPGSILLDGAVPKIYMKDTNHGVWYSSTANPFSSSFPTDGLAVVGLVDGSLATNDPANGGSKSIVTWNSSGKVAINQAISASMTAGLALTGNMIVSSGKLGVGTTTPTSTVEIQSIAGTPGLCIVGDTNGPRMMFSSSLSYGNIIVANNTNTYQQSIMAWDQSQTSTSLLVNNVYFSAGGSERLRISGTGSIGIATNSPLGRLHVSLDSNSAPTAWDTTQLVVGALSIYSGGLSLSYNSTSGIGYLSCFQPGVGNSVTYKNIQHSALTHLFYSCASSYGSVQPALAITTTSSSSTGIAGVGVGTSTPPGTFSVQFNTSPSFAWGWNNNALLGYQGWDPNTVVFGALTGQYQGGLAFSYNQSQQIGYLSMSGPANGFQNLAYGAASHCFYTNCGSLTGSVSSVGLGSLPTPVMIISNNGGVGFGTGSPVGFVEINSQSVSYSTPPTTANNADCIMNVHGADCTYTVPSPITSAFAYSKSINLQASNLNCKNQGGTTINYAAGSQIILNGGGLTASGATSHGSIKFFTQTVEKMRVDGVTGFVGIGTISPTAPLTIYTPAVVSPTFPTGTGGNSIQYFSAITSGFTVASQGSNLPSVATYGTSAIALSTNGSIFCGGVLAASDSRVKCQIEPITYGLDTLLQIKPSRYQFVDHIEHPYKDIGMIAQEIKEIVPESVYPTSNFIPDVFKKFPVKHCSGSVVDIQLTGPIPWKLHDTVRVISKKIGQIEGKVISVSDTVMSLDLTTESIEESELFLWGRKVDDFLTVDYTKLVPVLIQSIKDIHQLFREYRTESEARIEALENQMK